MKGGRRGTIAVFFLGVVVLLAALAGAGWLFIGSMVVAATGTGGTALEHQAVAVLIGGITLTAAILWFAYRRSRL